MSKHTQDRSTDMAKIANRDKRIAEYQEQVHRLKTINAELLAALESFNDAYSFISENPPHHSLRDAAQKARAAIAKARGQA